MVDFGHFILHLIPVTIILSQVKVEAKNLFGPLLNFDSLLGDSVGQFLFMMTLKIAPRQVYLAAVTPMEPAMSQMDTAMG